jgi:hypothetical protein
MRTTVPSGPQTGARPGPSPDGNAGESAGGSDGDAIESLVPARIDRLNWSKFHTVMVIALGVAWILDGGPGRPTARSSLNNPA